MSALLFLLLLLPVAAFSLEGIFEADQTEVIYREGKGVKRLVGNVRAEYDGMVLRADRAVYFESTGDVELEGTVSLVDSSRTLRAERILYTAQEERMDAAGGAFLEDPNGNLQAEEISYFRETKRALGRGSVELFDAENGLRVYGGYMAYEGRDRIGVAEESPRLIRTGDGESLEITGGRMVFYGRERKVAIHGEVSVRRGKFDGRCDTLVYLEEEERLDLDGEPILLYASEDTGGVRHTSRIEGDRISLVLREDVLEEIRASGRTRGCWAKIEANGDTLNAGVLSGARLRIELREEKLERMIVEEDAQGWYENRGDRGPSRIVAREIMARAEEEEFRDVIARGNVQVAVYLADGDETSGLSEASGDSAHLFLRDGEVARLVMTGGIEGTYRSMTGGRGDGETGGGGRE